MAKQKAVGKKKPAKQEKTGPKAKASAEEKLPAIEVLLYPLITEKAVNMIESENKICFVVEKTANKSDVKKAVEMLYNVKVDSVKTLNDLKGRKKAIVKINKKFKADELATKLGVL
ncbi:MAG: 50S ribosomal protein L23 [Candidatus ainarchaeum sp.]|nr:50S ribosomal protein L23 [Candidatus ainarchaeum sp.]